MPNKQIKAIENDCSKTVSNSIHTSLTEYWPAIGILYAYIHDDLNSSHVSYHLKHAKQINEIEQIKQII